MRTLETATPPKRFPRPLQPTKQRFIVFAEINGERVHWTRRLRFMQAIKQQVRLNKAIHGQPFHIGEVNA